MKNILLSLAVIAGASFTMVSCSDDDLAPGNPQMDILASEADALMGDSLPFTIKASDAEVPLSTLKAQLFFGEEKVSETVIRTKVNGQDYSGKIFIPYYKDIPNGKATLRYVLQNINKTITEEDHELTIARPDFEYITLVTPDGEFKMDRTGLYTYEVNDNFPAKINAYIRTPKAGKNGNELTFGWDGEGIDLNGSSEIPFSNGSAGKYSITFNTLTYEATPFIKVEMNGQEMSLAGNDLYSIDTTLTNGQAIQFTGIQGMEDWWIDPDFFEKQGDGSLKFIATDGTYRVTADAALGYYVVESIIGGDYATLADDGSGALWIIGEGVGKPSVGSNEVKWTTEKALCMAQVAPKKYAITLVAGQTIKSGSINFKFFGQKGWGVELTGADLTTDSNIVFIGDGTNGRDNGNLGLVEGKTLENGGIYRFTVDLTAGIHSGKLKVENIGKVTIETKSISINGSKMTALDSDNYRAVVNLKQNANITITGIDNLVDGWYDPDYFEYVDNKTLKFLPVDGEYAVKYNSVKNAFTASRIIGGADATLSNDGHGAIWMMGWGVGSPSLDNQFGWDAGAAYCMAEIAPKVYQFTGQAGPEKGSSIGQRFRTDYLSFKFFHQNGWGGEFSTSEGNSPLTISDLSTMIYDNGNFELLEGCELQLGSTYRITIDLTAGNDKGVITFSQVTPKRKVRRY